MEDTVKLLEQKQKQLQQLLPLPKEQEKSLEDWLRVELTYSSNAIEGNTLTRIETAEVIEKGVSATISGKSLKEQLEAINHAKAVDFIKTLAKGHRGHQFISEQNIVTIHKIILTGIQDEDAGVYRKTDVYLKGRDLELPSPPRVLYLMQDFLGWLSYQPTKHPILVAAQAHFKFVSIHPFADGNGRTGRLLMNLILLLNGYPMTIIRKEDREEYLNVLYAGQKNGTMEPYYRFIENAVGRSLDVYLNAAKGKPIFAVIHPESRNEKKLLRVGELAKQSGVSEHTIRYWTEEELLTVKETTAGGYKLYAPIMIEVITEIQRLKKELRLTLSEIKERLQKSGTNLPA